MADEWDPAKYVVEETDRLYLRADGRVEGGLYPPDFYKLPLDNDLFGGTWADGLQDIECFDWRGGAHATSAGQSLPQKEGRQEDEDCNHDFVKKDIDIDQEAETAHPHEPSTEALSQPVTSRLFPHGTLEIAASSPPIALKATSQPTHNELEDVELQEAPSPAGLRGLPIRPSEAPVAEPVSVSSSPRIRISEKQTETAVDTATKEEVVDTQAPSNDPTDLLSPKNSVSTLQDTDVKAVERGSKFDRPASTPLDDPLKVYSSLEIKDSISENGIDNPSPKGRNEHQTIASEKAVSVPSKNDYDQSTQPFSTEDDMSVEIVTHSEDELQDSNHGTGTNVQSTNKSVMAEMSLEDSESYPGLRSLSISDLLHNSGHDEIANAETEVAAEGKDSTEAEIPAVSNIFTELVAYCEANPPGNVSHVSPLAQGIGVTHTLDAARTSIMDRNAGTVLSTAERDDDASTKPDDKIYASNEIGGASRLLFQDITLARTSSDMDSEVEENPEPGGASLTISAVSPPWIPLLDMSPTPVGPAAEREDASAILVRQETNDGSPVLLNVASQISQQPCHAVASRAQLLNGYVEGLENTRNAPKDTMPDISRGSCQPDPLKITSESTNLPAERGQLQLAGTKEVNDISVETPIKNNTKSVTVSSTDAMKVYNDVDPVVADTEADDGMELDYTTTSKDAPNSSTAPHTLRQPITSTPTSALQFIHSKESNAIQPAAQDLKRPYGLVFKSPVTAEKMQRDVGLDSDTDSDTPLKKRVKTGMRRAPAASTKKRAAGSAPKVAGGRRPVRRKKQQEEPSDAKVDDVQEDNMDVMIGGSDTHNGNDGKVGSSKDAPLVPQTLERLQSNAFEGIPTRLRGDMTTKPSKDLLAAVAATISPMKNPPSPIQIEPQSSVQEPAQLAVTEPPQLSVIESPVKAAPLRKPLTYSRTDSASTDTSFAEYETSWGRPSTRLESNSVKRPNYHIGLIEEDFDSEVDLTPPSRRTSGASKTRAKTPSRALSRAVKKTESKGKKPEPKYKKKQRKQKLESNPESDFETPSTPAKKAPKSVAKKPPTKPTTSSLRKSTLGTKSSTSRFSATTESKTAVLKPTPRDPKSTPQSAISETPDSVPLARNKYGFSTKPGTSTSTRSQVPPPQPKPSSTTPRIEDTVLPPSKRTRAAKAEEDRAKERREEKTNIGKRLRGAGKRGER
jgi:hypothetical protein